MLYPTAVSFADACYFYIVLYMYYNRIPNVAASGQVNEVFGEAGKVSIERTTFISLLFYVY